MKIAVIGAGPAGSRTGSLLAEKGHSIDIYEKNKEIGSPVQCTGILSDHFTSLMDPKEEFVLNVVNRTRIYSPDGNFVDARLKDNYVICRKRFGRYLAEEARKKGASYYLGSSFKGFTKKGREYVIEIRQGKDTLKKGYDIIIGADGPLSPVAKAAGIFGNRDFFVGTQVEARMKNDNVVEFYPYLGCYAWIVPVDKTIVRIGVVSYKDSLKIFKEFIRWKLGPNYKDKIIENQSGIIPVFNPNVTAQKDKVYLVGDSATFVKATSGGGINQGLMASEVLAGSIERGADYDKEWRKKMYKNLHLHLMVHKMMRRFDAGDWNRLIRLFSERRMSEILYSQSRDRLVGMVVKIGLKTPGIFGFMRHFPVSELKNLRLF